MDIIVKRFYYPDQPARGPINHQKVFVLITQLNPRECSQLRGRSEQSPEREERQKTHEVDDSATLAAQTRNGHKVFVEGLRSFGASSLWCLAGSGKKVVEGE